MPWELNPFSWGRSNVPVHKQSQSFYPGQSLTERFFDDFLNPEFLPALSRDFVPSVDVKETDKDVKIEAELPGMEEKDIEVNLSGNMLCISGEKRTEEETNDRGMHRTERRFGSFCRSMELPSGLDLDKAEANFKNGVLCVKIPKTEEYKKHTRSIPIGTQLEEIARKEGEGK